jgi:uncharacterized protein
MLERFQYLEKIKPFIGKPIIKVITGQRRIGKSYFLKQLYLANNNNNLDSILINKEKVTFDFIKNYQDLVTYIQEKKGMKKLAVYIDEIQEIDEFEKALRNYHDDAEYDIYVTGSNATLLSGDLATTLSGRTIEIKMEGLSFSEFLQLHNLSESADNLNLYFQYGGLPGLSMFAFDNDTWAEYLNNIFNTIIYKDVIKRQNIRNVILLEKLVTFIADSVGSVLSARSISNFLKGLKINISVTTVIEYLKFLEQSFIIQKAAREDLKGKRVLEIGEKYYFTDLGIRNSLVGYNFNNVQKLLENAVFNHLKINGFSVTVGEIQGKEVDFVGRKNNEKIYIQVCYQLSTPETLKREFGNLLAIQDQYPKYVVGMDTIMPANTYEGIKYIHISDFLKKPIF